MKVFEHKCWIHQVLYLVLECKKIICHSPSIIAECEDKLSSGRSYLPYNDDNRDLPNDRG